MSTTSLESLVATPYKYGFVTDIETEKFSKGLDEDVIRRISAIKEEPPFLLDFRLRAYRHWLTMAEPDWAALTHPPTNFQDIIYDAAPKQSAKKASLDEVDPKLLDTFEKLGIPLSEQKRLSNVAVDAVFDSVSIATTFKEKLSEHGVIFCSISEAVREHPHLIEQYLGSVVPANDNFFATLNSAVFSDGSFVFIPQGRGMSHGSLPLFPHQFWRHRSIRAHVDRRGRGVLGELPGGLHGPDVRHQPTACRRC